jgi:hypothetical protein
VIALWAALGFGACASSGRVTRRDGYLVRVEERVRLARANGTFSVRANPTGCACPAFEVELGGVWQRVEIAGLEPDDPMAVRLDEMARAHDAAVVTVEGQLEEGIGVCARGALYVSLVPTALDAGPDGEGGVPSSSERR